MKVCVYGSSSDQISKAYLDAGFALGQAIGRKGWTMVFGGGTTGMMGAAVRGISSVHGCSIGVSPRFFDVPGILHQECTEFIYTETMSQRKDTMEEIADAFIITPGGIGTLDEFFEALTLKQLRQMDKPICLYNIEGCFDDLNQLLEKMKEQKFMSQYTLDLYMSSSSLAEILEYIEKYSFERQSV